MPRKKVVALGVVNGKGVAVVRLHKPSRKRTTLVHHQLARLKP